jgi:hypothetical protein
MRRPTTSILTALPPSNNLVAGQKTRDHRVFCVANGAVFDMLINILKSHLKTALKVRRLRNQMISIISIASAGLPRDANKLRRGRAPTYSGAPLRYAIGKVCFPAIHPRGKAPRYSGG